MTTLQLIFRDSNGTRRTIAVTNFSPDLTSDELRDAMTGISDSRVVERDGVQYYDQPLSAKQVETTEQELLNFQN